MANVREIIKVWLQEHGYDGLYHSGSCACDCDLDDLLWCHRDCGECGPGYKSLGYDEYDWCIGPEKSEDDHA